MLAEIAPFFGTGMAEVVSAATRDYAGWNEDAIESSLALSGFPWFARGLQSAHYGSGVFALHRYDGGADSTWVSDLGHRTILSGY
jgi:hypothetical protein